MQTLKFDAIGTLWQIDLPDLRADETERVRKLVMERIEKFDRAYSRFRGDSLVAEIAKKAGSYAMPDDAKPMISLYEELLEVTEGKMTPLIGQTLSDAGYDASYSLQPKKEIAKTKNWNEIIEYKHPILTAKEPVLIDFGAIGKGYLVDIVAALLRRENIQNYTVEAGGDIVHRNANGEIFEVGLEDPNDAAKAVGVAEIKNQSIAGSAGNRRKWGSFHHIIDPHTNRSPDHILALWVVADTAMLADALSTALFFAEPEKLRKLYGFEYAILYKGRKGSVSPNFPGKFFE